MSLIQEQEERLIPSFENFISIWTEYMERSNYERSKYSVDYKGMSISDPRSCLVGEAHKFTESMGDDDFGGYGCRNCGALSVDALGIDGKNSFLSFKHELYNHMLEAHWK